MPKNSTNRMTLTLNIEELRGICNYAHWIPILRGLHREFFETNYPGWEWNDILPVLFNRRIIVSNSEDPNLMKLCQGLSISREITSVTLVKSGGRIKVSVERPNPLVQINQLVAAPALAYLQRPLSTHSESLGWWRGFRFHRSKGLRQIGGRRCNHLREKI